MSASNEETNNLRLQCYVNNSIGENVDVSHDYHVHGGLA